MQENIVKIHASPFKAVMAITGGGAGFIGELLRYGDGSNTLLEAIVPYAGASLDAFLGSKPEKYCSVETARNMAMAAFQRARQLEPTLPLQHVIGLGATCSLVKAGAEREGRQHHVYIGVQTHTLTRSFEIELKANRNRSQEEGVAADFIEAALLMACGFDSDYLALSGCPLDKIQSLDAPLSSVHPAYNVFHGIYKLGHFPLNGVGGNIILPGSFNPPHPRHLEMTQVASKMLGGTVDFEISVTNVDKPMIHFDSLLRRLQWLRNIAVNTPHVGGVYLTNAPTFVEKVSLFPTPVTFVIGADTLMRIGNSKYYHNSNLDLNTALMEFERKGTKFLVFHRVGVDTSRLGEGLPFASMGEKLRALCIFVPEDVYKDDGTSSTKIRRG